MSIIHGAARAAAILMGIALVAFACTAAETNEGKNMTIKLTSVAFEEGQPIPVKYTCDRDDISPPLKWSDAPAGTKSFALIADDPDAPGGTWVHWAVYGLPATTTELQEKVPPSETLPSGGKQGVNDFGKVGYGGPCPPGDKPHRYFFKLYALDAELSLKPRATRKELLTAMEGHILGEGGVMGTYQRKK